MTFELAEQLVHKKLSKRPLKTLKDLVCVVDLLGGSHWAYTTNEISRQHGMPSSLVFLEVDVERPRKPRHLLPDRPLGAWDLQGEEVPVSFSKASSYISSVSFII